MQVEIRPSDQREVRNAEFIALWKSRVALPPGLDTFGVFEPSIGPPGRDIDLQIRGEDMNTIKEAALALREVLATTPGVTGIDDNTPYGREQIIYRLNAEGESLGLDTASLGAQLRAALDGELVQIFQQDGAEIEIRARLDEANTDSLVALQDLPVRTPQGQIIPLGNVVDFRTQRGFDRIRHADGRRAISVSADVIEAQVNATELRARLQREVLPDIEQRYAVEIGQTGQAENQAETFGDMRRGPVSYTHLTLPTIYSV